MGPREASEASARARRARLIDGTYRLDIYVPSHTRYMRVCSSTENDCVAIVVALALFYCHMYFVFRSFII